jgi:hypothetical protein
MKLQPFLDSDVEYSQQSLKLIAALDEQKLNQKDFEAWWKKKIFVVGDRDLIEYLNVIALSDTN